MPDKLVALNEGVPGGAGGGLGGGPSAGGRIRVTMLRTSSKTLSDFSRSSRKPMLRARFRPGSAVTLTWSPTASVVGDQPYCFEHRWRNELDEPNAFGARLRRFLDRQVSVRVRPIRNR